MATASLDPISFSVPIMSGETRRRGLSRGAAVAIGLSVAVHVAAGAYLYMARFETRLYTQPEPPATIVDLFHRTVPPPEPATPPPEQRTIRTHVPPTIADVPNIPTPIPIEHIESNQTLTDLTTPPSLPRDFGESVGSNTPEPTHTIANPTWLSQPSGAELSRFYPERAARMGLGGHATIHCAVAPNGRLNTCSVVSEDPSELGFGNAAVRLSSYFRMRPRMVDGQAVGGEVNIPLTFRVPN